MIKKIDSLVVDHRTEVLFFIKDYISGKTSINKFNRLTIKLGEDILQIQDLNFPNLHFTTGVEKVKGNNVFYLDIVSRVGPVRSPYIFAKELSIIAFNHFSKKFNLDYVQGEWYEGSDNYKQFIKLVGNELDNDEVLFRAARSTWTGRLAELLGYKQVSKVTLPEDLWSPVLVYFSK